jgi:hypothetical protein
LAKSDNDYEYLINSRCCGSRLTVDAPGSVQAGERAEEDLKGKKNRYGLRKRWFGGTTVDQLVVMAGRVHDRTGTLVAQLQGMFEEKGRVPVIDEADDGDATAARTDKQSLAREPTPPSDSADPWAD